MIQRPRTRGDCVGGARPCPFVGCAHHLALDITEVGTILLRGGYESSSGSIAIPIRMTPEDFEREADAFIEHFFEQGRESCELDGADAGGLTLQEVGERSGVTRERVRQIETEALAYLEEHHADDLGEGDED